MKHSKAIMKMKEGAVPQEVKEQITSLHQWLQNLTRHKATVSRIH